MKDHLRQLASVAGNDLARTCLVREYLQARILESLQDSGAFLRWAFVGGTALRFLYSIPCALGIGRSAPVRFMLSLVR